MQNKRALYLLLAANVVSGFAAGITMLAIPWYFIDILEKSTFFGWLYAITTLGTMFWSLYAGTLIDRYPRKKIFLSITTTGFLFVGGISAVGFIMGELPVALVSAVFCFTMMNFMIHYPALYAFGQEITEKKNYAKINSLIEVQAQATHMFGGALAVILLGGINKTTLAFFGLEQLIPEIEPWEIHEIFLLDAITYLLAIFIISRIKYTPLTKNVIDTGKIIERVKVGFRFLKNNIPLFIFGNFSYAIFLVLLVEGVLLLPMYVDRHLESGPEIFSLSHTLYSFGALAAGISIRWVYKNSNYVKAVIYMLAVTIVIFYICVFTKSVLYFCVFNLTLGLMNAGTRITRITFMFNHIPNNVIGRTSSVFHMINTFLRFSLISLFSLAFFSEGNNVIYAYFICATFLLLCIIPLLTNYRKLSSMKEITDSSDSNYSGS